MSLTRCTGDILLYSNHLVLYKSSLDLTFYVVGAENENELMLSTVLGAFYDAVSILLRHQVEKRAILENLDLVVLCLDETVDDGCVALLISVVRMVQWAQHYSRDRLERHCSTSVEAKGRRGRRRPLQHHNQRAGESALASDAFIRAELSQTIMHAFRCAQIRHARNRLLNSYKAPYATGWRSGYCKEVSMGAFCHRWSRPDPLAHSVTRWRQAGLVHLLCTSRIASRACHEALQWEQLIRADDHAAGVDMEGLLITDASW